MTKTNTTKSKTKKHKLTLRQRLASHRPLRLYSILATLVVVGLVVNGTWMRGGSVLSYATDVSPSGLLASTNQSRAANGVGALSLNSQLMQAASSKAADMVNRDYWSHNTPDGQAPWVFVTNAGYSYQTIAENLAYGFSTSDSVVTGWMNSSGHRTNMLNSTYTEVGFASANSANYQSNGNQTVVVAFYGTRSSAPAPIAVTAPAPSAPAPAPTIATTPTAPVTSEPVAPVPETTETPIQPIESAPTEKTTEPAKAEPASDDQTKTTAPVTTSPAKVSRIQQIFGPAAIWIASLGVIGAGGMGLMLAFRHSLAWHRTLIQGEQFVLHHKAIDVAVVGFIMAAIVMMQAIGAVR